MSAAARMGGPAGGGAPGAHVAALPEAYAELGFTPEQWQEYLVSRGSRQDARRAYQSSVNNAAQQFKSAKETADRILSSALKSTDNPLTSIFEAGYDELSLEEKLLIERGKGRRQEMVKEAVNRLKVEALDRYNRGEDPFPQ